MADSIVTLRLAADGSQLGAVAASAQKDLKELGKTAEATAESLNSIAETADEQTARLREMAKAAMEAAGANGAMEKSANAIAQAAATSRDKIDAQNAALMAVSNSSQRVTENIQALADSEARIARQTVDTTKAIKDEGAELQALLAKISPAVAKLGELDEQQKKLAGFKRSGALSGEDFDVYASKIAKTRVEISNAAEGIHGFSLESAGAKREIGVLLAEMSRGDFTKFQGSMLTLANRTGLLSMLMTPLALGIGLVAGAVVGLVAAFVSGYSESQRFGAAIIATGNYSGQSTSSLRAMAEAIGSSTGRYRDASAALTQLAGSGRVTGAALQDSARGAVALATLTGESIDKAAGEFQKLSEGPSKAILDLNEKYNFLTLSVYDQIKALENSGKADDAAALAAKVSADALAERAKTVIENAGWIERKWLDVKEAATGAWEAIAHAGAADRDANKAEAIGKLITAQNELARDTAFGRTEAIAQDNENIAALEKLVAKEMQLSSVRAHEDAAAGALKESEKRALDAGVAIDKMALSIDKVAQKKQAIDQLNAQFTALANAPGLTDHRLDGVTQNAQGGFSGGEYSKLLDDINKKYAEHVKKGKDAGQVDLELANAWRNAENMVEGLGGAVNETDKAQADFNIGTRNLAAAMNTLAINGADFVDILPLWQAGEANLAAKFANTNAQIAARGKLTNANAAFAVQLQQQADKMSRLSAATLAYDHALADVNKKAAQDIANGHDQAEVAAELAVSLQDISDIKDNAEAISIIDQFGKPTEWEELQKNIAAAGEALRKACDKKTIDELNKSIENMNGKSLDMIASSAKQGLQSLQSMTKEGSKGFKAMQIAIDAVNVVQAIGAVLNQGNGDPYSAFARMAAMAAAVVALGVDIGSFGSGGVDSRSAEEVQKKNGTGTILGDADAKSESIAKAAEITANATSQLVGLNRGMLTALQALQNALGAAGGLLAHGAGDAAFAGVGGGGSITDSLDPIGGKIAGFLFGGSQKIIDQGIQIAGGALNDMLNGIVVGAYQTIHTSGGLFGGGGDSQQVVGVSDEFTKQFQLVIQSIADTVKAGATALGLLPADIQAAMDKFKVEEINISLKGLSADDQQKEIEAAFSKIFDQLAGAVVPFIGEFQKVGEGLGETLVRVATEVQVAQESFKQLGISVSEADPQKFAEIADGLIQAAGGLDEFIKQMTSFQSNFGSDSHQFAVDSASLNSAFSQAGLTLPKTRDGMFDLMQSLDATTEAGRAQIATLLRLADTAGKYYSELDKVGDAQKLLYSMNVDGGTSDLVRKFQEIQDSAKKAIDAANLIAIANGKEGASVKQLAQIHTWATQQFEAAIKALEASAQDNAFALGISNTAGSLESVNAEIQRLQGLQGSASANVGAFGDAMQQASQAAVDAINLLLGTLSPLSDAQKLETAMAGLRAGTVTQDAVLEIGRRLYASSQAYTDLFNTVKGIPGLRQNAGGAGGAGSSSQSFTAADQQRLAELLKQQQTLQAAQTTQKFEDLAQQIAEIASVKGKTFQEVIDSLNVSNADLEKGLGLKNDAELKAYLDNLKVQTDADADNTTSIVAVLNKIFDVLSGKTPTTDGSGLVVPLAHGGTHGGDLTLRPGQAANDDAVVVPAGTGHGGGGRDDLVLRPSGTGSSAQVAAATTENTAVLRDVRTLLTRHLAVTTEGNAGVRGDLRDVAEATRGIDRTLARGNAQDDLSGRRNERRYAP